MARSFVRSGKFALKAFALQWYFQSRYTMKNDKKSFANGPLLIDHYYAYIHFAFQFKFPGCLIYSSK